MAKSDLLSHAFSIFVDRGCPGKVQYSGVLLTSNLLLSRFLQLFCAQQSLRIATCSLPDIVFSELNSVFDSTNINLLSSLGINLTVPLITDQLIDEDRPLLFGVSSDLFSTNAYTIFIILINAIIVEAVIAVINISPKDSFIRVLSFKREQVYYGFIVSILVQNILPWKYATSNRFLGFKTKVNCFCYQIIFTLMGIFILFTFLSLFSQDQKRKLKKGQMHEWMIGFQNFLYPLFVLSNQPLYFLVIILFSKIAEIIIFAKYSNEAIISKFLQMGSFGCQLIYHLTFFVFSLTTDQKFVIYSSIVCLFFFLLGALINFFIVAITLVSFARTLCKNNRNKNRVKQSLSKAHKDEAQISQNQIIRCGLPRRHKDNDDPIHFKQIFLNKNAMQPISRINNRNYIWKLRLQKINKFEAKADRKVVHLFKPKKKFQE